MDHVQTLKDLSADFKKKSKEIQAQIDLQTNALKAQKVIYDNQARQLDLMAKKLSEPAGAPKKTRAKRKPQTE